MYVIVSNRWRYFGRQGATSINLYNTRVSSTTHLNSNIFVLNNPFTIPITMKTKHQFEYASLGTSAASTLRDVSP